MTKSMSPSFEKKIKEILADERSDLLTLDFRITSTKDKDFCIPIKLVDRLRIKKLFMDDYIDNIHAFFQLTVKEYIACIQYYNSLQCILKLTRFDPQTMEADPKSIEVFSYRIIFTNKEELNKKHTHNELIHDFDNPATSDAEAIYAMAKVEAQLMTPQIYVMRKQKMTGMLQGVTLLQTIYYLAEKLKCTKVKVDTPDNQEKYTNMLIPPLVNLSEGLSYLDERYGVYNNGFSFYVSHDILHVYPITRYRGNTKRPLHVYRISQSSIPGAKQTTQITETSISTLITSGMTHKSLAEELNEQIGNATIIVDNHKEVEGWLEHKESHSIVPKNRITTLFHHTPTITDESLQFDFKFNDHNIYKKKSMLSLTQCDHIQFKWNNPPFDLIEPGHDLILHYTDSNDVHQHIKGSITSISYEYTLNNKSGDVSVFNSVANVSAILFNHI